MAIKFFQKVRTPDKKAKDIDKLNKGDEVTVLVIGPDDLVNNETLMVKTESSKMSSTPWNGYRITADGRSVFATGNTKVLLDNKSSKTIETLQIGVDELHGAGKVQSIETGNVLCGQKWLSFDKKPNEDVYVEVSGLWLSPYEDNSNSETKSEEDEYIFPTNGFVRFIRKKLIAMNEKK
ncbi:MAG: hypothetical protein JXQ87_06675 [Bacteroidia bacterium]